MEKTHNYNKYCINLREEKGSKKNFSSSNIMDNFTYYRCKLTKKTCVCVYRHDYINLIDRIEPSLIKKCPHRLINDLVK